MAGFKAVQAEVAALLRHYASALAMPGHVAAYAEAIAPAAWDAFSKSGKLHEPEVRFHRPVRQPALWPRHQG